MKLLKRSQLKPGISYRPVDSHGEPLIGTLETVPGVAQVNSVYLAPTRDSQKGGISFTGQAGRA